MEKISIELTEQEADWLKSNLEYQIMEDWLSSTSKAIINNILTKIEHEQKS